MNQKAMKRLARIEKRVNKIFLEHGLNTTPINFEVVTAERMIEAMAYRLPANFSHWSFGRNFEKVETGYRHSGHGIPYEMVWNFDKPTALLVDTNPFALNVLILAHVYGHIDFHLSNIFMKRSRELGDVIEEARSAKQRFLEYERRYGVEEVEKVIDAALTFQLHQDQDPFADDLTEDEIRARCLANERGKLLPLHNELAAAKDKKKIELLNAKIESALEDIKYYETHSPPVPEYDINRYLIAKSPKMKKPWIKDTVTVVRKQMKVLSFNRITQLLNEGWATYWHKKVMRQLFKEKLITPAEYEQAIGFDANVTQKHKDRFNVYHVGPAFFKMIKDRWDKGKFGPEWEACRDREARANWDKKLGLGNKKILELRKYLSDRMAIESYFDDDFIRDQEMYIWKSRIDKDTKQEVVEIAESRPEYIREMLIQKHTTAGIPAVAVMDADFKGRGELLLQHFFSGFELNPKYEEGALEKLYFFWEKPVRLITYEIESFDEETQQFKLREVRHKYDGKSHDIKTRK